MDPLSTLKQLQQLYQAKFADLIAIHNTKNANGLETPEYFRLREEWIQAGNDIKNHLELMSI
ncbi:MAG: hypothetical protein H7Y07_13375 [Pyrinomonadaceae bacterium]|nr:hypothetical protein [Sphingobacteriaceae bacterium]